LSSNPNLQNIPIRTAFRLIVFYQNRAGCWWQLIIRKLNCGFWLILVKNRCWWRRTRHEDIHTVTARLLFEKETVTPDERRLKNDQLWRDLYARSALREKINKGVRWQGVY